MLEKRQKRKYRCFDGMGTPSVPCVIVGVSTGTQVHSTQGYAQSGRDLSRTLTPLPNEYRIHALNTDSTSPRMKFRAYFLRTKQERYTKRCRPVQRHPVEIVPWTGGSTSALSPRCRQNLPLKLVRGGALSDSA